MTIIDDRFDDFCVYSVSNTVLHCLMLSTKSKLYQKTVNCFENGLCACLVAFRVCGLWTVDRSADIKLWTAYEILKKMVFDILMTGNGEFFNSPEPKAHKVSLYPVCLKTLCSLSPPPVMLHINFEAVVRPSVRRRPSVCRRPHFQTWISLKPVGQTWSRFMCSITGVAESLHKVLGQIGSRLWFPWQQKFPIDL